MSKFKVGDKVKFVKMDDENFSYKKYLGKVYTIKGFDEEPIGEYAYLEETSDIVPFLKNLELVKDKYTYEDLKKSPIGTKITFESGITLIKINEQDYKEIKNPGTSRYIELLEGLKDNWQYMNQGKITKIEEPTYKTVYEHKEEILDEAEKRYLRGVIRPFRDKVEYICKYHHTSVTNEEFICICFLNSNGLMLLPYFKEHSMYKGMELDKNYTLEELGL